MTEQHWHAAAAEAARKAVPNEAFKSIAVGMATSKPFALDYVLQAPALVMAAAYGRGDHFYSARQLIVGIFAERISARPKLRDLMSSYGLAYPFRALKSTAIIPSAGTTVMVISRLGDLKTSALAQAIPEKPSAQTRWLKGVAQWSDQLTRRGRHPSEGLLWAVAAAGVAARRGAFLLDDVADFFVADPACFNPKWTFDQAKAATERWHRRLGKEHNEIAFYSKFGLGFSEKIDYGALPLDVAVDGYRFVALDSGEELFAEGFAMHHCVGSYSADVINGDARIYSIRDGDRRLATLELHRRSHFRIRQLKGPCNSQPPAPVRYAAIAFEAVVADRLSDLRSAA